MIKHSHLSSAEHIATLSDRQLVYLRELLRRGPVQRTKMWEDIHEKMLEMCNEFLKPIEGEDLPRA